jgi:hypothetical protein
MYNIEGISKDQQFEWIVVVMIFTDRLILSERRENAVHIDAVNSNWKPAVQEPQTRPVLLRNIRHFAVGPRLKL